MLDLKTCRICLRSKCKLYKYSDCDLETFYQEITSFQITDNDGLPQYFCYECATFMYKYHKFKEKCFIGYEVLKEIQKYGKLTYQKINDINKAHISLKSPLDILTVSERVKTYRYEDTIENIEVSSVKSEHDNDDVNDFFDNDDSDGCKDESNDNNKMMNTSLDYHDDDHDDDNDDDNDDDLPLIHHSVTDTKKIEADIDIDDFDETFIKVDDTEVKSVNGIGESNKNNVEEDIVAEKTKRKRRILKSQYQLSNSTRRTEKWSSRPKFTIPKKKLNMEHWEKIILGEEDAHRDMKERAETKRYKALPHKCTDCFLSFSKPEILEKHRHFSHNNKYTFVCNFCRYNFRYEHQLRNHMRQHFTKYKCLRCDLICKRETIAILHDNYHNGTLKRRCETCGKDFMHTSTYYTHLRMVHRSTHICSICGRSFVTAAGLRCHRNMLHRDNTVDITDEEVNTYCEKCDIKFETKAAFQEHLSHSTLHSDENEFKPRIGNYQKKKRPFKPRRSQNPRTVCHQCGKKFPTQAACKQHHLAEHPRTSFHAPSERHICEICGASLAPGSIATHQNMHTRQLIHACTQCDKTFYSAVSLYRHRVVHTGERPYPCPLCDKRFTQSNSMKLHYRTIHLKQPYPKRNRNKKKLEPKDDGISDEKRSQTQPENALYDFEPRFKFV